MARRKAGAVPQLQHHKGTGQGKVHLGGRDFYCGKWGSSECKARYDRLIAEWLQNGRRLPSPAGREAIRASAESKPSTGPVLAISLDTSGQHIDAAIPTSLLVCEVAARYMEYCETYYRGADGKTTSSLGNAKQAIAALSPVLDVPAASLGPKKFQEMRALLVERGNAAGKRPSFEPKVRSPSVQTCRKP